MSPATVDTWWVRELPRAADLLVANVAGVPDAALNKIVASMEPALDAAKAEQARRQAQAS
jgi:hypothetical protein